MPTVACAEYGGGEGWAIAPAMATARAYHGVAVVCGAGEGASACALYAVGGSRLSDASNGEGALASVEVFVV